MAAGLQGVCAILTQVSVPTACPNGDLNPEALAGTSTSS